MNNTKYLKKIFIFIQNNYNNNELTTDDISKYLDLNKEYTLKLFKNRTGNSLIHYLNTIRISFSLIELMNSEKNISNIAKNMGFKSQSNYNRVFKNLLNMTPNNFLNLSNIEKEKIIIDFNKNITHIEDSYSNVSSIFVDKKNINIDFKSSGQKKIKKYFKKILFLGRASQILKADVQYQIKEINNEIGFEYIKIHSIFDDLGIYNEDSEGNVFYNFSHIDKIIDFLIEVNLKPFITIGYMPKDLSSKDQTTIFNQNVSYPKDIFKWTNLISNLINHFVEKYGESSVSQWYFEIWNNPNFENVFWYESMEKYFFFFKETFQAIKNDYNKIKVGGPSILIDNDLNWINKFINYLKINNIKLDFFSIHSFSNKYSSIEILTPFNLNKEKGNANKSESLSVSINRIKKVLKETKFEPTELFISEWNSSPYFLDLIHDTCYMSTYIIDNILNNFNKIDGLAYRPRAGISEIFPEISF